MTTTPTPRQLPGVKGQWILCSDCPPTEADTDSEGEVRVFEPSDEPGARWAQIELVCPNQYWCPADHADPRPFTLPTEPTPQQPAAVARKFVQVVPSRDGKAVFAVADDGTAWVSQEDRQEWRQVVPLPDREVG